MGVCGGAVGGVGWGAEGFAFEVVDDGGGSDLDRVGAVGPLKNSGIALKFAGIVGVATNSDCVCCGLVGGRALVGLSGRLKGLGLEESTVELSGSSKTEHVVVVVARLGQLMT